MNLDPNPYFFPNSIHIHYPNSNQISQQQDHPLIAPSNSLEVSDVATTNGSCASSLLCGLSLLNDKIHQVQSLAGVLAGPDLTRHEPATLSLAMRTMGSLIQEIKGTATSMLFYCQQLNLSQALTGTSAAATTFNSIHDDGLRRDGQLGLFHETIDNLYAGNFSIEETAGKSSPVSQSQPGDGSSRSEHAAVINEKIDRKSRDDFEIIELDVADLLAKYTHFCCVCRKGFKRDANLRMHMRAHGAEYKTSAALSKPVKSEDDNGTVFGKKYSCPQEGCRWNRNHPKFQPLKSMICVKNHYKRNHCPKTYVCKRCNRKRFSVLSDLRTHEKHCGDAEEWRCTCGTTFSRKDKLMGHVSLFIGHTPAVDDGGIKRSVRTMQTEETQLEIPCPTSRPIDLSLVSQ